MTIEQSESDADLDSSLIFFIKPSVGWLVVWLERHDLPAGIRPPLDRRGPCIISGHLTNFPLRCNGYSGVRVRFFAYRATSRPVRSRGRLKGGGRPVYGESCRHGVSSAGRGRDGAGKRRGPGRAPGPARTARRVFRDAGLSGLPGRGGGRGCAACSPGDGFRTDHSADAPPPARPGTWRSPRRGFHGACGPGQLERFDGFAGCCLRAKVTADSARTRHGSGGGAGAARPGVASGGDGELSAFRPRRAFPGQALSEGLAWRDGVPAGAGPAGTLARLSLAVGDRAPGALTYEIARHSTGAEPRWSVSGVSGPVLGVLEGLAERD
jgi:hypothetical protein